MKKFQDLSNETEYLYTPENRWDWLGTLLTMFGANYSNNKKEISLYWGVEDYYQLKFLLQLLNSLAGSSARGFFYKQEKVWKIYYG